jgi:hypothetical protein
MGYAHENGGGEGKILLDESNQNPSWLVDTCLICGGVLGAGLDFWLHGSNGAVFGSVLGITIGYALTKPNEISVVSSDTPPMRYREP